MLFISFPSPICNILSGIATSHLPTSHQNSVSCLSSSPAYPSAPHEQSTSVYLEDRCFDDHLPPVALWIHLPLRLLSHLQLQSSLVTYKDCSSHLFSLPSLLLGSKSMIQCYTSSTRLPPSTSPSSWVTFQQ